MSNEVQEFIMKPANLAEAMRLCEMIAKSSFCPSQMRGKAGDVMLALQLGTEVGLSYMQALQNIAIINGKPTLWGDGALAVAMSSPYYEYHREWFTGDIKDKTLTAHCLVKRKGADEYEKTFSIDDAIKAKLWSKEGVWQSYPSRMLQMRARAFAIRDQFADALRGIQIREEVEDYEVKQNPRKTENPAKIEVKDVTPEPLPPTKLKVSHDELIKLYDDFMDSMMLCDSEDELKEIFLNMKKVDFSDDPESFKRLMAYKDVRKNELKLQSNNLTTKDHEDVERNETTTENINMAE